MHRADRIRLTTTVGLLVVLHCAHARPAAAVDLTGVYASVHEIFNTPCTLTFTQSGSALTIVGPCVFGSPNYTFDMSGTVDEITGTFQTTGVLHGLCETPGSVTMDGTGDGTMFTATTACGTVSAMITGSKCNNGMLDAGEDCEDGNTAGGDCCSPTCQHDGAGTACAPDASACTLDECDGAGQCVHPADPGAAGQPCPPDLNFCTDDVCDAAGQCTHPPNSNACDDFNPCTDGDSCAAGACVGGPPLPECSGSLDLTGDWEVTSEAGMFAASPARRFVQTGVVLESTDLATGLTGVGSVNPATRAFQAHTPFAIFFFPCLEVITGTATTDAQEFTGTSVAYCGIEGTFGPYDVTGRRCDPIIGCACEVAASCTSADRATRIAVSSSGADVRTRWRWSHSAMEPGFGDPRVGTDYRFCFQTPAGNFVETAMHGSNWRSTRTGFRYSDALGPVRRLSLQSTPNQVSISASVVSTAPVTLPLTVPLTVRLIRLGVNPDCFEATFDSPSVNTTRSFRAEE